MEVSNYLVSWFITFLRDLQTTYIGVISHLLSTMDIPVRVCSTHHPETRPFLANTNQKGFGVSEGTFHLPRNLGKVFPKKTEQNLGFPTWRIIPVSKWLVTPIYKLFRPFGRGPTTLFGGLTNHGY